MKLPASFSSTTSRARCTTSSRRSSSATSRRRRPQRDRRRRRRLRQSVRHRCREGRADLEAHFDNTFVERTGGRGRGTLCPGGLTATPVIAPDGHAGQVHRSTPIPGMADCGRSTSRRARRSRRRIVAAAERQTVCAESLQQRPLHDHGAGLRRQSEHVLLVRSRDQEGRPACPAAAACGRARARRSARTARVYAGTRRRRLLPEQQIYGQSDHRREAGPRHQGDGDEGLVHADQRLLAAQARPRHERHGPDLRLEGQGIPRAVEQGMPACGCSTPRALGGEDHRTPVYRTPLICNEEVNFAATGIWGALASWEDQDGTRYVLVPFWGPKHSQFKAPIEYGEVTAARSPRSRWKRTARARWR